MRHSVVGIFDNDSAAQNAIRQLSSAGIGENDVELINRSTDGSARGESQGFGGKISSFFKSLTGSEPAEDGRFDTHQTYYSDQLRQGRSVVIVNAPDEQKADRAADVLQRQGARDITEDDAPRTRVPEATSQRPGTQREQQVIPVVEEEIKVGKRTVQRGGVRIYKHVEEKPVDENVALRQERVTVERRPANRPATDADLRARDTSVDMTETSEEPVVSKQARVVEEVVVGKDVSQQQQKVHDTVRKTSVDVQRGEGTQPQGTRSAPAAELEPDFRRHCQVTFPNSRYEDYSSAYEFGSRMSSDPRYRGKTYTDIESNLRRDYEAAYPGSAWDRFKNAVRYGWDRATGKVSRTASR